MALPAYVTRSYGGGAEVAQLVQEIGPSDTSFTITPTTGWTEADGNPLGTVGPFTVVIDRFTDSVEKIMCSAINLTTGVVTVETSGGSGRGYDGTSPQAHVPGGSTSGVQTCWSSIEAAEANKMVAQLLGAATTAGQLPYVSAANALAMLGIGTAGSILESSGAAPEWLAPGANGTLLQSTGAGLHWVSGASGVTGVPAGRLFMTTTVAGIASGGVVEWDTQDFVTGGMTSDLVTTYSLIAPAAGYYDVNCVVLASVAGTGRMELQITRNATAVSSGPSAYAISAEIGLGVSDLVYCSLNDKIAIGYLNNGANALTANGGTAPMVSFLSMELVSS